MPKSLAIRAFVILVLLGGARWLPTASCRAADEKPKQAVYKGKTVKQWTQALHDSDLWERALAAKALGRLGSAAKEAVPALSALLKDEDVYIRRFTLEALELIGPSAKEAVPALYAMLKDDESESQRPAAAVALWLIQHGEKPTAARLIAALKDKDKNTRWVASYALRGIEDRSSAAVPALIETLKDKDFSGYAASAVAKIGKPALPAVIRALQDKDAKVRLGAAKILGQIEPKVAKSALASLSERLNDKDESVRQEAAEVLWHVEPTKETMRLLLTAPSGELASRLQSYVDKSFLPALLAALQDKETAVCRRAVLVLVKMDGRSLLYVREPSANPLLRAAVPEVIAALQDEDTDVRRSAASALAWLVPKAKAVVPALIERLKDKNAGVRLSAAFTLAQIDRTIEAVSLRGDKQDPFGTAAFNILRRFGVELKAAMPALIEMLKDEDAPNRWCAVALLGQIGPEAEAALPLLRAAVNEEDPALRFQAALALWKIEGDKKTALRILLAALKDKDLASKLAFLSALEALAEMGADAREAIPALTALMKENKDHWARYQVAWTLLQIDRRNKPALSVVLAEPMDFTNPIDDTGGDNDSLLDASYLRDLGPEAKAATPVLLRLIQRVNFNNTRLRIDLLSGQPPLLDTLRKIDPQAAAKVRARLSLLLDAEMQDYCGM